MMTARRTTITVILIVLACPAQAQTERPALACRLLDLRCIWDRAPHCAFTDLARWHNRWWCVFREGEKHADDIGRIQILSSLDGRDWNSAAVLQSSEYDLRDPKLSVMPDGRLMLVGGAQKLADGVRVTGTFASFSSDGSQWSEPQLIVPPGRWLWRVTWHDAQAYGVSYPTPEGQPFSTLLVSRDGVRFQSLVPRLHGEGMPTEATLRFDEQGTCYALHRRDGDPATALLGIAQPPYTQWIWHDLGLQLGGPNFIQLPRGRWIAAGRLYEGGVRTELLDLDVQRGRAVPVLRLPSGGDTSYPGLVWHDDRLWVSYYSSHEEKAQIYLAQVEVQ